MVQLLLRTLVLYNTSMSCIVISSGSSGSFPCIYIESGYLSLTLHTQIMPLQKQNGC